MLHSQTDIKNKNVHRMLILKVLFPVHPKVNWININYNGIVLWSLKYIFIPYIRIYMYIDSVNNAIVYSNGRNESIKSKK